DPPFTNLDLVSCRNLLIYLGPALQEKALKIFQYALKPRGILMLGRSENIGDFSGRFSVLNVKRKVFFERMPSAQARLDFIPPSRFTETESAFQDSGRGGRGGSKASPDAFDLQGELDGVLPPRYIPNGVVVNGDLEILRFLGNTSAYLRPAPGKPSLNLRRMASGELLLELRAAIHVAKKSGSVVRKEFAAPRSGGAPGRVRIEVLPIKATDLHQEYFLVLFDEVAFAGPDRRRAGEPPRGKESRRVIELKEDLAVSGEHLKAVIEEQEATNARLRASNEELLSSNEELQSINEEFETSKEELQSTNEELITSSEEVARGNQVLKRAYNDLSNLLANINIPIVLLGPDLSVRRFTPPAEKALDLSTDKIGRSVADVKLPLRLPRLKELLLNVIKTGQVQEREVQDARGRWYHLFLRPYRTDKSKTERSRTDGAVMALIDIHDRKLSEKSALRLAALVHDSNDAVIVRDLRDRIIAWNAGAQKMYGYTVAEALGMNVRRLLPEDRRMLMREFLGESAEGKPIAPIETKRRAKDGRTLDVLLTVTVLRDEEGRPVELATTERDITEQKRAARELRRLHASVILAQETERKRLARELHDGVAQMLLGVKIGLESLFGDIDLKGRAAANVLKMGGALERAIVEIRRVSQNLMPSELVDLGLEPALRALCREFKGRTGIPVALEIGRLPKVVAPELELALFRIAQEALNNIGKHSKATTVAVALSGERKEIALDVSDNGIGFTPGSHRPLTRRGIGLGSMRERAASVGGSVEVRSAPGAGTALAVRVPLSGLGGG
ncbi:MAG: PAS domain S-box protein, partial [Elusimicrobia bacterium]|nr:PAS domain S-box protein [Elusimicrobiota bacterium]